MYIPIKCLKNSCQNHKIGSLLIVVIQVHDLVHFTGTKKVVENLLKKKNNDEKCITEKNNVTSITYLLYQPM